VFFTDKQSSIFFPLIISVARELRTPHKTLAQRVTPTNQPGHVTWTRLRSHNQTS
jgi:hypothetical protein